MVRQVAEEGAACPGSGARSPTSTLETQLCYAEASSETSARIYAIKWMSKLALLEKPMLEAPCTYSRMVAAIAGTGLGPRPRSPSHVHALPVPMEDRYQALSLCLARRPLSSMLKVRRTPACALLALFGLQTQNPSYLSLSAGLS